MRIELMNRIVNNVRNYEGLGGVKEYSKSEERKEYCDLSDEDHFFESLFDGAESNVVYECQVNDDEREFLCEDDFNDKENDYLINELKKLFFE